MSDSMQRTARPKSGDAGEQSLQDDPARLIKLCRLCAFRMTNRVKVGLQLGAGATDEALEAQAVAQWVNTACEFSECGDLDGCCVTVRIVDEAESQHLTSVFRHQNRPTNVLAFPGAANQDFSSVEAGGELGDIVICLPLAQREAGEQQKPRSAHLAQLVIHGTLHLLGYRHGEEEDSRTMEDLEVTILRKLGIPDPYATGAVISKHRC